MGVDQFKTKLQAAIMVGDGPDMVIADNIELLSNIDKSIEAGAFLSFDEYITDWNSDTYYMRAVEGARSADGKSYLIPPFL